MTPNTIITTGQHTTNEAALIDPAWLAERDRASRGYLVRKDALYLKTILRTSS